MTARSRQRETGATLIWERPEPTGRPTPAPLSRESIVRAAIAIADTEGLTSVSLRKVGAALDAGPMRLYGYLSTKEELLELMVDAVYEEMAATEPIHEDWREALRSLAYQTRQAARKHPWFIGLLGGRPHQGPNALAYLEAALAVLSDAPGFEDIDVVLQAIRTVNAYVIGAIQGESNELQAESESNQNKSEWQVATYPYLRRMIATGRFPTIARVVRDAVHPPADVTFDRGLESVLDGIAVGLTKK